MTTLDVQKRLEAQARYDRLTAQIAAVDTDIARTTDGVERLGLESRREELSKQRDGVAAELTALEKRTNGDIELLQRRVQDLARVLTSDHPQEAHAIIDECVTALSRLDARVAGIEGRVTAIERRVYPPWQVRLYQVLAVVVAVVGAAFILSQRVLLVDLYPIVGGMLGIMFVALACALLLLAHNRLGGVR